MADSLPALAGNLAFSGISLELSRQSGSDWMTNKILGLCLGLSHKAIKSHIERHPEAFTEADTRLVPVSENPRRKLTNRLHSEADWSHQERRIWSFPDGCLKVAVFATTDQAKAFALFLLAHKQRQTEHWRLKALQREHYLYSKRPRMRLVVRAADAGLTTRQQAEAAGFRCLESARRNRKEAEKAGLLATPALPESVQGELFALNGEV